MPPLGTAIFTRQPAPALYPYLPMSLPKDSTENVFVIQMLAKRAFSPGSFEKSKPAVKGSTPLLHLGSSVARVECSVDRHDVLENCEQLLQPHMASASRVYFVSNDPKLIEATIFGLWRRELRGKKMDSFFAKYRFVVEAEWTSTFFMKNSHRISAISF